YSFVRASKRYSPFHHPSRCCKCVHSSRGRCRFSRRVVDRQTTHAPCRNGQQVRSVIKRFYQRTLGLLHIFVICERKTFHDRQQLHRIAENPSGRSTHEFQRIGIQLLRHRTAAGRVCIRQAHKRELLRRKDDQLLREPTQMNRQDRDRLHILDRKI